MDWRRLLGRRITDELIRQAHEDAANGLHFVRKQHQYPVKVVHYWSTCGHARVQCCSKHEPNVTCKTCLRRLHARKKTIPVHSQEESLAS